MTTPAGPEIIVTTKDELFEMAARRFTAAVGESIGQRGRSAIALSGGSTPEGLYRILAREEYRERIAWDRVHFFWGDERCVPSNHPLSNYRVAHELLLSHLEIQPSQVHRIPAELAAPSQAASRYEDDLLESFDLTDLSGPPPRFDLMLLGLGADGHTASLFPYSKALAIKDHWAVPIERPGEVPRVTLTLPVLNAARQIHFIATGEDKALAVRHVIEGKGDAVAWPARLVQPEDGRALWFLDGAAASRLERSRG
jgi:6-phosphogluconolactonase